jgi:Uma2 family endonuclease
MGTVPRRDRPELADGQVPSRTRLGAVILDRPATLEDLDRLPRTWRGEILDGTLYAFPRPRAPHQLAGGSIHGDLRDPFHRGRNGPGGWWILPEPGIQLLPRSPEFSPDVAGWRRERLPGLPRKGAITVVPDWVCEILSPRTRSYDHVTKRRFYAESGVAFLWYVDPIDRTLTAAKLADGRWLELGAWRDDERPRVEPFEAIEIDLAGWWEGVEVEESGDDVSPLPPSAGS